MASSYNANINDLPPLIPTARGQHANINDLPPPIQTAGGQHANINDLPPPIPTAGGQTAINDLPNPLRAQDIDTATGTALVSGTNIATTETTPKADPPATSTVSGARRNRRRNLDTSYYSSSSVLKSQTPTDITSSAAAASTTTTNDKNYLFYTNQLPSEPDGDLIDNIHMNWKGDYGNLDKHARYISWLFPTSDRGGINARAQPLQPDEIERLKADGSVQQRLTASYVMMLDYYGLQLKDATTGEIERAPHFSDRLSALNASFDKFLCLNRIIKSLGLLGFERYQSPLVEVLLREIFVEKTLPNAEECALECWITSVKDDAQKQALFDTAYRLKSQ